MEVHLRATEYHLPYGITQCYLPADTSEPRADIKTKISQICLLKVHTICPQCALFSPQNGLPTGRAYSTSSKPLAAFKGQG